MVNLVDTTTKRNKAEIGYDKTKMMTNNPNGFQTEIKIKGHRLEAVENKYMGSVISNERLKPEILFRVAHTIAAFSKLKVIWTGKNCERSKKEREAEEAMGRQYVTSLVLPK